ncbi:MAG TPA: UDP-glucose 4-epimerase GalE [Patescibacteria group bacterium]|nr:UDP-glucose 4-epimerase GalE [Patescibacteria group bacterium]
MRNIILVTGGAGYIGAHVCKALSRCGYLPVAYDNLCSGNESHVKWGPFEEGDIRDTARLSEVIQRYRPGAIMHFAALIQVGESVSDPAKYYDNNVNGSLSLLQAARAHDIRHLVFSSTAAVYGMPQGEAINENHPLVPINPYGRTKLAMENMIRDFADAYGLKYAILRYFNAAGADVDGELGTAYKVDTHIVPLLMKVAAGEMSEIKVFGTDYASRDGTAIRDYIHVQDLAEAHVLALRRIRERDESLTLNLGTSEGHTVQEVLEKVREVTRRPVPSRATARRPGDPERLVADASRARDVLNWQPRHSDLHTIVSSAWDWHLKKTSPDTWNNISVRTAAGVA